MYLVYAVLVLLAFDVLAMLFGADSRPLDIERATRWFAGHPRDWLDQARRKRNQAPAPRFIAEVPVVIGRVETGFQDSPRSA